MARLWRRLLEAVAECAEDARGAQDAQGAENSVLVTAPQRYEITRSTFAQAELLSGALITHALDWQADTSAYRIDWLMELWAIAIANAERVNRSLAEAMVRRGDSWLIPVQIQVQDGKQTEAPTGQVGPVVGPVTQAGIEWQNRQDAARRQLMDWVEAGGAKQAIAAQSGLPGLLSPSGTSTATRATRHVGPSSALEVMQEQLEYLAEHGESEDCQDVDCVECRRLREAREILLEPVSH